MRSSRLPVATLLSAVMATVAPADRVTAQDDAVAGYHRAIAEHFGLPATEIRVLAESRLQVEEIPVALFLAQRAGISADALVALKRGGRSWDDLARRYDLGPGVFHVPVQGAVTSEPLARTYQAFRSTPSAEWSAIRLEDVEVIHLVNLRVISDYLDVDPARVLRAREREGSFVGAYHSLARTGD